MISDTEIPLAILHCSTEMYCNPKYDFVTFFKSKTPTFFSTDMIIENTQDIVNTDTRQIKRKVIPETCESQNDENVLKKIRFDENKKKHISGVNKNNIVTRDIDNRESKHKVIPETYDSQINNKILKSSYLFYENERPGTSESNIAIRNSRDADNKEIERKITDKTCDSQNNENISKKTHFFNESEQRYISDTSTKNIAAKTQNNRNIIKNIYFSNESEQKNISDSSKNNILSNNANEQFQIISDSCLEKAASLEKNISNIFSDKSNSKQDKIIFETCEFNEKHVNNFATEKEQQTVNLQKKEIFKENNVTFATNQEKNTLQKNKYKFQQRENMIINEENNTIFEKNNLSREENSIIGKDNLNNDNGKFEIARWEKSKNAKIPQTVAINDREIYIKQGQENDLLGKDCCKVELQDSPKERKLSSVCISEKNHDKRVKEDKIQTKDNRKKESRKTVSYLIIINKIITILIYWQIYKK